MAQFSVHDAKTNLSKLIATALKGGEVIIARGNVPAVRLVPVVPRSKRQFACSRARLRSTRAFPSLCPMMNWKAGIWLEAASEFAGADLVAGG